MAARAASRERNGLLAWLALVAITALAAWLSRFQGSAWLVLLPLALTVVKGHLIVDVFMDLARAPRGWRLSMLAYVWTIAVIIAAVYLA